jgi:hypothetical protein
LSERVDWNGAARAQQLHSVAMARIEENVRGVGRMVKTTTSLDPEKIENMNKLKNVK